MLLPLLGPLLVVASAAAAIADAERAFAARCAAVGIRQSFLEFFADDGISFAPDAGNAIQRLVAQVAPTKPRAILQWGPEQTEAQGDLGWSTGPTIFGDPTGKRPDRYGYYFSIWRRQRDGTWKVELDLGTDTTSQRVAIPGAAQSRDLQPTREPTVPGNVVLDLDRRFCEALALQSKDAYGKALHADARVHRAGQAPLVGERAWRDWASKLPGKLTCKPQAARLGSALGLGYAYGIWERLDAANVIIDKGAYVRVWRFEQRWGIAVDVATK